MDYLKYFEKAVMYIENNLHENITVNDVAKETGYSYYHLTRLFKSMFGESVGSYIKKRRLVSSTKELLYSDKKVIDIAIGSGFESSEAFSRAFKSIYKVSPIEYRKNRIDVFVGKKKKLELDFMRHLVGNITIKPVIKEIEKIKVIGIKDKVILENNSLPDLWEKFRKVHHIVPNTLPSKRVFGICEAISEIHLVSESMEFNEIIGLEVNSYDVIPNSFVSKTIKEGKYAIFTHTGSLDNLDKTYEYIWGTWFLSSKEELDIRDDFDAFSYTNLTLPTELNISLLVRSLYFNTTTD
ncbi:AraC family transcriptional regulator [Clostridioides difficile]|uniref:AraC family transcriptional regulator n=11 Tax=Bacteria TaxID=2 RepID=UPI000BC63962|nr:AraC family transcriptional regulator [Clostridioides difficile]PBI21420.1 AraC family transcriptional regulator [Clostridioides difficile]